MKDSKARVINKLWPFCYLILIKQLLKAMVIHGLFIFQERMMGMFEK